MKVVIRHLRDTPELSALKSFFDWQGVSYTFERAGNNGNPAPLVVFPNADVSGFFNVVGYMQQQGLIYC